MSAAADYFLLSPVPRQWPSLRIAQLPGHLQDLAVPPTTRDTDNAASHPPPPSTAIRALSADYPHETSSR
jgi:hypothetical protein